MSFMVEVRHRRAIRKDRPVARPQPKEQFGISRLDLIKELRDLSDRARRLCPPLSRDPERFHTERSELARDILKLTDRLQPTLKHGTSA